MYYAIGASVSSLHRESTDSLIHVHVYVEYSPVLYILLYNVYTMYVVCNVCLS